jgi:hypothetical protein
MIYLGHFYFDGQDKNGEEISGNFSCLAESDSVEKAVKKFEELIFELRGSKNFFDGKCSFYLEGLVEVQKVPDKAIVVDFVSTSEADLETLSRPMTQGELECCTIYDWGAEGDDEDGDYEEEPFMEFDAKPGFVAKNPRGRHLRVIK